MVGFLLPLKICWLETHKLRRRQNPTDRRKALPAEDKHKPKVTPSSPGGTPPRLRYARNQNWECVVLSHLSPERSEVTREPGMKTVLLSGVIPPCYTLALTPQRLPLPGISGDADPRKGQRSCRVVLPDRLLELLKDNI